MPRLKVFCLTSGFHDAVVAAPSRPAALKAWGAKTDLFSMGVARQVTDKAIVEKAMKRPGEVIRLSRADGKEQAGTQIKKARPRQRPPSRAKLAAAEERLAQLEKEQAAEMDAIEKQLKALETKRERIAARHGKARAAAELKLEQARDDYDSQLAEWEA